MAKSLTYKELIAELMPIYDADRARFMRFYDAVWLMLYNMAEGDKLVIADRCREADRQLFFKVACLIMISDMRGREYYFYDEEKTQDEISMITGIPQTTVSYRLKKVIEKLREIMGVKKI